MRPPQADRAPIVVWTQWRRELKASELLCYSYRIIFQPDGTTIVTIFPGQDRVFEVFVLGNGFQISHQKQQFIRESHQGGPSFHCSIIPIVSEANQVLLHLHQLSRFNLCYISKRFSHCNKILGCGYIHSVNTLP